MWSRFGKDFAYVQTGLFEYIRNGTTLSMHKRGSGLSEIINPLIDRFLLTKEYFELCEKWGFTSTCYVNDYFPEKYRGGVDFNKNPYFAPTADLPDQFNCSSGYCQCDA